MKKFFILFILSIIITCLTACEQPNEPTTELTQTLTGSSEEIFEISGTRFTAQRIGMDGVGLAAADLNDDGHLDVVVGGEPMLTIYLGDGTGRLDKISQAPGGQQPDNFALADIDEDGDMDIIIANHDTDHLTILLGIGDGTFQLAANSPLSITVSPHPHEVRAVDIDRDGHLDLIVDDRDGKGYLILRGLGDGSFESGISVEVGGDPYRGMALGDLDGDGDLDLVSPNPTEVGVLLNQSREQIVFQPSDYVAAQTPFSVALGDFNGDSKLDLITASGESDSIVELFWGNGAGGFVAADSSTVQFAKGAKQIAVGDFNGDKIDDAVISAYRSTDVLIIFGGGDPLQFGTLPGIEHPWSFAVADLNEDNIDDLVIGDDTSPEALIYLSLSNK